MITLIFLLACEPEAPPITAPQSHSWTEEAELVIAGLDEVERLAQQRQWEAARRLAEDVYHERWDPELERAAREMEGPVATGEIEYLFGLLMHDLQKTPSRDALKVRIRAINERVRKVADAAQYRFPPIGEKPSTPPPVSDGSHPIEPKVTPAWETLSPPKP